MLSRLNRALKFTILCGLAILVVCPRYASAAAKPSIPATFITALAADASGNVWLATEDEGMCRMDTASNERKQFKSKDGTGDDTFYAVAADRLGRIWCGSLNHGVSVYNGRSWRVYGLENGPLGVRVFDIQCSPTDGDVWITTSAGLARYRIASSVWSYYTRLDGLPADQVQSLAFNRQGDVIAGLQCGGVAIAKAADQHRQWTATAAPWYFDKAQRAPYTLTPLGDGLPSNLINGVLVTRDNTIWAATVAGLAWSRDNGQSWRFLRGRDYADRVKGLLGGAPKGWKPPLKGDLEKLLPEDYVTCLAEAPDGNLWLGFRKQGCAELNPKTVEVRQWIKPDSKGSLLKDGYVNKLLPLPDGRILAGGYGGGLQCVRPADASKPGEFKQLAVAKTAETLPPFPAPAAVPDEETLRKWTAFTQSLKTPAPAPGATYLGEDWSTQGDWVNRYGRRFAMLCAMNSPWSNHPICSDPEYDIAGQLGPHFKNGDELRHWVHWIKTDNPRSLYTPAVGIRRQAEWDDHGEAYPISFDGPDVWSVVKVPQGSHRLSLYFFNKDGHGGNNRYRDYLLELRCYKSGLPDNLTLNHEIPSRVGLPVEARSWELTNAIPKTVLARARVRDFFGGVYKTFVVQGSGTFYVRVVRHGSFNTIVSAVLADKLTEPVEDDMNQRLAAVTYFGGVRYAPPDVRSIIPRSHPTLAEPLRLWDATQGVGACQRGPETFAIAQGLAYRAVTARRAPQELVDNWRWHLRNWDEVDRRMFTTAMTKAWASSQDRFAYKRSTEFCPHSPNVVSLSIAKLDEMEKAGVDWRTYILTKTTNKASKPNNARR